MNPPSSSQNPVYKKGAKELVFSLLCLSYGLRMMRRTFVMLSYGTWHGGLVKGTFEFLNSAWKA